MLYVISVVLLLMACIYMWVRGVHPFIRIIRGNSTDFDFVFTGVSIVSFTVLLNFVAQWSHGDSIFNQGQGDWYLILSNYVRAASYCFLMYILEMKKQGRIR